MANYYETLSVSQTASEKEITKAYRALAKKFHPDTNPAGTETFKEISAAYDTLSDKKKRAAYDQTLQQENIFRTQRFTKSTNPSNPFGSSIDIDGMDLGDIFSTVFTNTPRQKTKTRGKDIQTSLQMSLKDAVFGTTKRLSLETTIVCPTCEGYYSPQSPCITCHGAGEIQKTRTITTKIPPGVNNGQTIKIKGKGGYGTPDGDLSLQITLTGEDNITLLGKNLHLTTTITLLEALLGTTKSVDVLGDTVSFKIPECSQNKAMLRVKGKGARTEPPGDLLVTLDVSLPKHLSKEAKELVKKLNDLPPGAFQ